MAATVHQIPNSGPSASREEEKRTACRSKDLLWEELFRDRSQLWDKRNRKPGPRYPDFKHKHTREPLWIHSQDNPPWVSEELCIRGFAAESSPSAALPDSQTDSFAAALRTCTKNKDLLTGTRIHNDILQRGLLKKCSGALVIMYAKCGKLGKAKELLDMHTSSNAVPWTALISSYARAGQGQNALDCFEQMRHADILPDAVTYACVLKACATIRAADKGRQIHYEIARRGLLQNDIVLGNALVDMYAKCAALSMAEHVLKGLPSRNVVSWSALIAGYVQEGQAENALNCFEQMQREGILPDATSYSCVLKACAMIGATDKGKEIHEAIAMQGLLQNDIVLGTALVDLYAKCGDLSMAQHVLEGLSSRNVVSWSALIAGYSQEGQAEEALNCFEQMQHDGIVPNAVTYASVLKACAIIRAADKGKQIHDAIARQGLLENSVVLGCALVDMYVKCGSLSMAQCVLEDLPSRNVTTWSALIAGYAQEGEAEQALNCFEQMQYDGIFPNAVTYTCVLKACATIGSTDKGREIHDEIANHGLLQNNIELGNALVDMYAKCGALSMALRVLEGLPSRDVISWSALIAGYAQEGRVEQAVKCFEQMQHEGILPDVVTFSCVLNVCSHLGLVEEGQEHFMSMSTEYDVKADLECYTCMVDLFGRAGHLEKAVRLIQEMPSSDYLVIWLALLGACQKWGDVHVGRWAFEQAVQLDKGDGPGYILMANIYAAAGMQDKARKVEAMRITNKASSEPARSLRASNTAAHAFSVGDTKHAQSSCIHVEEIVHKMARQRYSSWV